MTRGCESLIASGRERRRNAPEDSDQHEHAELNDHASQREDHDVVAIMENQSGGQGLRFHELQVYEG